MRNATDDSIGNLITVRNARLATFASFFLGGYTVAMWASNVPLIQGRNDVSDGQYAIVALYIGIGATVGCIAAGRVVDRWGPKWTLRLSAALYAVSLLPVGFATGAASLGVAALTMGFLRGATDTSVNAHGVAVERRLGRSTMLAFHAAWPAGGLVGGLVSAQFMRMAPESPVLCLTVNGIGVAVAVIVLSRWYLPGSPEGHGGKMIDDRACAGGPAAATSPARSASTLLAVALGCTGLCAMLGEASSDWTGKYLHEQLATTTAVAALAFAFFSAGQLVGRLGGDALTRRWGATAVTATSGLLAALGLAFTLVLPHAYTALLGLFVFGLGLAPIVPLVLATAGRIDPARSGTNIGIVNMLGYGGLLVGPVLIGTVVVHAGLTLALLIPAVLALVVAIIGPQVMRKACLGASHSLVATVPNEKESVRR
ncbi:MFS transporter [Rhodococcus koreensis]